MSQAESSAKHGRHAGAVRRRTLYNACKRAFDLIFAALLFVVTLPVMTVAAVLILLTTGRSPLLLQQRIGKNGQAFAMLKLRTMRVDSPDPQSSNPLLAGKSPDDPRVTAMGRLLRRSSIDELPQLLNVIAGQMSLVGPRPALPREVAIFPQPWQRRLDVKPGLSGLWQVSGRSEVSPRRMVAMDRLYITRRGFGLDGAILLRTVTAILSRRGAW